MKIGQLISRTIGTKVRTETVSAAVSTVTWDPAIDGTLVLSVTAKCVVYLTITSSATPYSTKLIVRYPDGNGQCALRWPSGTVFSCPHQQPSTLARTQTTFDLNWNWTGTGTLEVSNRAVTSAGFIGDSWGDDLAEYDIHSCFDTWVPTPETPNDATSGIICAFLVHSRIQGSLLAATEGMWNAVDANTREWVYTFDSGQNWEAGSTIAASGTVTGLACSLLGTRLVAILDTGGTNQARTFTGTAWGDFGNTFGGLTPNKVIWAGTPSGTGKWLVTFSSWSQIGYIPLNGGTWSYSNLWGGDSRTCRKLSVDYTTGEVIAIADSGNYVSYSDDWGETWTVSSPASLTEDPVDVVWVPGWRRWIIIGASGSVFVRDTATGTTWTDTGVDIPSTIRLDGSMGAIEDCVYFMDTTTPGIRLFYSIDGGINWVGKRRVNKRPNNFNLWGGSPFTRRFMWMLGANTASTEAYLSASPRRLIMGSQ